MLEGRPPDDESPPAAAGSSTRPAVLGATLAVLVVAVSWPLRARYLYEWDSVQFALGARSFDVARHQPHPPGYPLWVLLVKAVSVVTGDANTAMIVLAIAFTWLAVVAFYLLAESRWGPSRAAVLVACVLFSPVVVLYSTVAATYTVDLALSCVVGLLASRAWHGDRRAAFSLGVVVAVFAGIRQSGAVLMAPLACAAMIRGLRAQPRTLAAAAGAAGGVFAAWFVPTAWLSGGATAFLGLGSSTVRGYFGQASVLFGGPGHEHVTMILQNAVWLPFALAPALALALARRMRIRTLRHEAATPSPASAPRLGGVFHALWLGPNLAYVFLLHAPKPGYLLLSLPPLVLWLGGVAAGTAGRAQALVAAGLGMVLASTRYDTWSATRVGKALHLASLGSVVESDRTLDAVLSVVPRERPHEHLLVTGDGRKAGASQRKLSYYLPEHLAVALLRKSLTQSLDAQVEPFGDVPSQVRFIWWFRAAPDSAKDLREAFPDTTRVFEDPFLVVYRSEVGDEPVHARVSVAGHAVRLYREVPPALGDGFSHLETPGAESWRWSLGARSTVRVPLTVPGRVRLHLEVAAPRPEQVLTVRVAGRDVARFEAPRADVPSIVDFEAGMGTSVVELLVNRHNGAPERFAERDARPLGLRYRRILVQALGRDHELIPRPAGPPAPAPQGAPTRPAAGATAPTTVPPVAELAPGQRIDFTTAAADYFLGEGWSGREASFRWAVGERATLKFRLAEVRTLNLVVRGLAFERQRIHVLLNGQRLGTWTVDGQGLRELELQVPASRLSELNELTFEMPDGKSPKSAGLSDDTRRLGIAVQWLSFQPR